MSWYRWQGDDLLITLHVQPRARQTGIVGLHGDALKIKIAAPPEDGRANREIIELLAENFAVARSAVSIERGSGGRRKQARIASPAELPALPDQK